MATITIIQASIFIGYVAYIWDRFGVLSSISASSYALKGNDRYMFTGWLVLLAITSYWQPIGLWGHLMAIGFVVSGMSIDHNRSPGLEDEFHTYGTVLAIVSAFAGLCFVHGIWIPAIMFTLGAGLFYIIKQNWIWWTEIWAMAMVSWGFLTI